MAEEKDIELIKEIYREAANEEGLKKKELSDSEAKEIVEISLDEVKKVCGLAP